MMILFTLYNCINFAQYEFHCDIFKFTKVTTNFQNSYDTQQKTIIFNHSVQTIILCTDFNYKGKLFFLHT